MQKFSIFYFKIAVSRSGFLVLQSHSPIEKNTRCQLCMFLDEFIKLCDQLCFSYLKTHVEIHILDFQMHFVLSQSPNAGILIDSLFNVK